MDDVLTLAANLLKELSPVVPFTQLKKIFLTISTDIAANISRECIESLKASIGTINAQKDSIFIKYLHNCVIKLSIIILRCMVSWNEQQLH